MNGRTTSIINYLENTKQVNYVYNLKKQWISIGDSQGDENERKEYRHFELTAWWIGILCSCNIDLARLLSGRSYAQ